MHDETHAERTPPGLGPADFNAPAATTETHISSLWFVGDRVYKLKKPASFGFLDFSTRESRLVACRREVELNRRLAPDVYLGVVDLVGPAGPIDHLVAMRRMPTERRLATLVAGGDREVPDHLRRVARLLADFHSRADRSVEIDSAGRHESIARNWEESFDQLRPFAGDVFDAGRLAKVEGLVERYLAGRGPLFEERVAGSHICDGHGDLQAADIYCLDDGPRVLDCIEFNDRFRHGDVVADVAFLAMDLDLLGVPELRRLFLGWYDEFSGTAAPGSLVQHYIAYRAQIRALVSCLRSAQTVGEESDRAAADARNLLDLAHGHLQAARVRLTLVGGPPGTGKSTLAAGLAAETGWTVLRSDEIRKELAGLQPTDRATAPFGSGIYTDEMTDRVYTVMLDRAATALARGESVVLDASWISRARRGAAAEMSDSQAADLDEVRCEVPPELARARTEQRAATGDDTSDAGPSVATRMAAEFPIWPTATVIDASDESSTTLRRTMEALGTNPRPDRITGSRWARTSR